MLKSTARNIVFMRPPAFPSRVIGGELLRCSVPATSETTKRCESVFRALGMTEPLARVPATRNGDAWEITATTEGWAPANSLVFWEIWEVFADGFSTLRERGSFTFTLSAGTAGAAFDPRSVAEKTVAMLEKALSGSADPTVKSYQINNRRIDRYSATELLDLLNYWRKRLAAESGTPQDVKFYL